MPKTTQEKIPITERALIARINRKLARKDEALRKCSESSRWHHDLGDYYGVDLAMNAIAYQHVDLEEFGRELGVLRPTEALEMSR